MTNQTYANGTTITTDAQPFVLACHCTGTRIRTARGEVPVEHLQVGDRAVTAADEERPIRWIGHRTLKCQSRADILPVRIAAHAFGENRPARDLLVSPGHALAVDVLGEVLIPAIALVNGATIVQEAVEAVTYWHVELDRHDLLLAEGLPAESYLDMGNRRFFAEDGVVALHAGPAGGPDGDPAARTHADFCRPFHGGGALVEVVRAQMRRRAEALGWRRVAGETWAGVHLEVDGRVVRPRTRGRSACFEIPAAARELWLCSPTSVPRAMGESEDDRVLGLCLAALRFDDGLGVTQVGPDDPRLEAGFYAPEPGRRWTAGRARLPAGLLAGLEGTVLLRLDLAGARVPRWIAPDRVSAEHPEDAAQARAA